MGDQTAIGFRPDNVGSANGLVLDVGFGGGCEEEESGEERVEVFHGCSRVVRVVVRKGAVPPSCFYCSTVTA
jgi:hypothetical protein